MSKKHNDDSDATCYCSFCGKSQEDVAKLIAGPAVYICDECIELCMDIVREDPIAVPLLTGTAPTHVEIRKALDSAIEGQDDVKRMLSAMLHRHFERIVRPSEEASTGSSPAELADGVGGATASTTTSGCRERESA